MVSRQRTASNGGIAIAIRRVAEDERTVAFFEQRFAVPAARYGGNLAQLAGNFKRFIITEGKSAARFAKGASPPSVSITIFVSVAEVGSQPWP